MTEAMTLPVDSPSSLERRRDRKEPSASSPPPYSSPPPPPPPPPARRRDRDSRERRDNQLDRPPRRDYNDRTNNNTNGPHPSRMYNNNKRRASPPSSPPPNHHRDRRPLSPPPPRRSPPLQPFKRSRRNDGGFDARRGSPNRDSYGPGDRRFGYDYPGGYDREFGGRPGYPDERPHGRYGGRPTGGYQPSDWDSARGAFNNEAVNRGSNQREGLMSYKQFIQELEDDILPAEAERRYQEYRSEYISTQKRAYFSAHKDEAWLKDKYHPTSLLAVIERRNEHARKVAKDFLLDLQSSTLDLGPGINASSTNKSGQTSEHNSDDDVDVDGKRKRHGRGSTKEADPLSVAPKAHPVSSEPRRVLIDVEQAQGLVRKLDLEKGIEDNILCRSDNERTNRDKSHGGSTGPVIIVRGLASVKGLEGIELLDTLITYLWRIHGLDYYGMIETNEAKGLRHIRVDGKSSDVTGNAVEWEKKLDSYWQERLKGQDPLEVMTAKENIDAAANESLDPYVRKIRDEKYGWKYGCGAKGCTKLFHASEFVHKHLKLKHLELVLELTSKVREDLYFQNYMSDGNAPGGTPVMQQSIPLNIINRFRGTVPFKCTSCDLHCVNHKKEKPPRRRLGQDNRMKDERGRRDRANGGDRYDRSDNPQTNNNDAQVGSNPDESMFDSFSGPGMHVNPYASDTVLMPVPGAGPLGPFVPAPPEIFQQIIREQGGPYEGGGRSGMLTGPSPIIALPPQFRQDPRRLRSYQDLDAPEDEVTVIDYRSL